MFDSFHSFKSILLILWTFYTLCYHLHILSSQIHPHHSIPTLLLLPGLTVYGERGNGRMQETEVVHDYNKNSVFQTKQGDCTHELTVVVTLCTRSAQDQARQKSRMEEGGHKNLTPSWGAMGNCWGRELVFLNGVAPDTLTVLPWMATPKSV